MSGKATSPRWTETLVLLRTVPVQGQDTQTDAESLRAGKG